MGLSGCGCCRDHGVCGGGMEGCMQICVCVWVCVGVCVCDCGNNSIAKLT